MDVTKKNKRDGTEVTERSKSVWVGLTWNCFSSFGDSAPGPRPPLYLPKSSQRDSTPSPRIALLDSYFHILVTKGVLILVPGENFHFGAQGCGSV